MSINQEEAYERWIKENESERQDGIYLNFEQIESIPENTIIINNFGGMGPVTVKEFKCAMKEFVSKNDNIDGPYTEEQITIALTEYLVQQTINALLKKGLLEEVINANGEKAYQLSPKGKLFKDYFKDLKDFK